MLKLLERLTAIGAKAAYDPGHEGVVSMEKPGTFSLNLLSVT